MTAAPQKELSSMASMQKVLRIISDIRERSIARSHCPVSRRDLRRVAARLLRRVVRTSIVDSRRLAFFDWGAPVVRTANLFNVRSRSGDPRSEQKKSSPTEQIKAMVAV
jgi:hypothetical protein